MAGARGEKSNLLKVNYLLDELIDALKLKNDAALARALEVAPPVISKLRHGGLNMAPSIIIRVHEATNWSIRDIKERCGLSSLCQQ